MIYRRHCLFIRLMHYAYCIILILWHHNSQLSQYGSCWWFLACLVSGWSISGVLAKDNQYYICNFSHWFSMQSDTYAENDPWLLNIKLWWPWPFQENFMLKYLGLISLFSQFFHTIWIQLTICFAVFQFIVINQIIFVCTFILSCHVQNNSDHFITIWVRAKLFSVKSKLWWKIIDETHPWIEMIYWWWPI